MTEHTRPDGAMNHVHTVEVVVNNEASVKLVEIRVQDVNRHVVEAAIKDIRSPMPIVTRRCSDGQWEPLYALEGQDRKSLPHCFSFNEASILALDAAVDAHNARSESDDTVVM